MKKTLLLFTLLSACSLTFGQWKKIKGNGKMTTVERAVGEYDQISMSGWYNLVLVSGNEGQITLEGEENLLENLKTEVKNGKLTIKAGNGTTLKPSNWNRGITITVPVEEINAVSLSGSGDIIGKFSMKAKNFETNLSGSGDIKLEIEATRVSTTLSGSGDITLSGQATDHQVSVSGSGDVTAGKLNADFTEVSVSGSADVRVHASEMLKVRVSGSAEVTYAGNPKKIDTKTSGSGEIRSM